MKRLFVGWHILQCGKYIVLEHNTHKHQIFKSKYGFHFIRFHDAYQLIFCCCQNWNNNFVGSKVFGSVGLCFFSILITLPQRWTFICYAQRMEINAFFSTETHTYYIVHNMKHYRIKAWMKCSRSCHSSNPFNTNSLEFSMQTLVFDSPLFFCFSPIFAKFVYS